MIDKIQLRITGKNNDGEYWLHLVGAGQNAGFNLGDPSTMVGAALLKAASGQRFVSAENPLCDVHAHDLLGAELEALRDECESAHMIIAQERAEVIALRAERDAAYARGVNDAADVVAQGWCQPTTSHIEMDVTLAQGIQAAIRALLPVGKGVE